METKEFTLSHTNFDLNWLQNFETKEIFNNKRIPGNIFTFDFRHLEIWMRSFSC